MFGAISIPIFALTPGWNPMVPCPPAWTLLASRLPSFLLYLPVLLFHVLSLITMPFSSASLSLNLFFVSMADGNWSSGNLSFFKVLATSGQDGGRVSFLFHLFSIGGTEARNISKVLRSAMVVVPIMNVLCRALSSLPLLVIWRVESMISYAGIWAGSCSTCVFRFDWGWGSAGSLLCQVGWGGWNVLSFLLKVRNEARNWELDFCNACFQCGGCNGFWGYLRVLGLFLPRPFLNNNNKFYWKLENN